MLYYTELEGIEQTFLIRTNILARICSSGASATVILETFQISYTTEEHCKVEVPSLFESAL
jgi:hypothetical protein